MTIPLERAYLCECGMIGDCATQCASCANRCGLMNLAGVLNRKPPLMAETSLILSMLNEVGSELMA